MVFALLLPMILPLIITIALAEYAARDDFHQIGNDDKIRHGIQWLFRASVVTLACWLSGAWWLAFGMAGLFSAMFRWRLNTLRDDWWWYLGPSVDNRKKGDSRYDGFFHQLVHGLYLEQYHHYVSTQGSGKFPAYPERMPGTFAYIFEGLLFVGVTLAYICSTELAQRLAT